MVWGAVARTAASQKPVLSEQQAQPPAPFTRVCAECHASNRIVEGRRFRSQWEEVIEAMLVEGAKGSDDDFRVILEYLVSAFGRVNVNAAPAPELQQVLHLESGQAESIVDYRKKNGKFADFDALIAMPAAPVEALTARRDAPIF